MNTADLRSLADRAEGIHGRPSERLGKVQERIRITRRRRRTAAVVGAAALALVIAGGAAIFRPDTQKSTPAPATPSPTLTGEQTSLARPLTYAVGKTIHYGDQVIDTGQRIAAVDITDAGVVYLTRRGQLWFTDGSGKRQIDPGTGSYNEGYESVSSAVGSRIAYMRYDGDLPVAVVVYDVASGKEVLNEPAGPSVWPDFDTRQPESKAMLLTVDQVVVYYSDDNYRSREVGQVHYVSYDLATGEGTEVPLDAPDDIQVAPSTRALQWRARGGDPENLVRRSTDGYRVRDGVLTVDVLDDRAGVWRVADLLDPVTEEPVAISVPEEVPARTELRLFQWLGDGVFAVVETARNGSDTGPILVCTLAAHACEVAEANQVRRILPGREFYE